MKIVFNPKNDVNNQYPKMFVSYFGDNGFEIYSLKELMKPKLFKSIRVVHLNWFENILGKTMIGMCLDFVIRLSFLFLIKISGKKLIWTMHNKMPHNKNGAVLKIKLIRLLIKYADAIIIHCKASKDIISGIDNRSENRIHYIPHPNYIGIYGPRKESVTDGNKLQLLFMGAVKSYKNIELLINVVKKFEGDVVLKIAGRPESSAYAETLKHLVGSTTSINLELAFVKDEDIPHYISGCDLLVFPYDIKSSLNSGSVILAFSYGKSVICPEIGTILDLSDIDDVFHYKYDSIDEHSYALEKQIEAAILIKKQDNGAFEALGQKLYNHVYHENSLEESGQQFINLYKSLDSK